MDAMAFDIDDEVALSSALGMSQKPTRDQERRLAEENRSKFQGTGRIRLEYLHFPDLQARELDWDNVRILVKCYQDDECNQFDPEYHVPAVIDKQNLIDARPIFRYLS